MFINFSKNIYINIFSFIPFKNRCLLRYINKYSNYIFLEYNHPEVIEINFEDYYLIDKFRNIKFEIVYLRNNDFQIDNDDLKNIKNIHSFYLNYNELDLDLSILKNINTLTLTNYHYLSNVSPLSNIYKLDLSHCIYLEDVSPLGNIYSLCLHDCRNVEDISKLINNYELNICCCNKIRDISSLKNVNTLHISHNNEFNNPEILKNIKNLFEYKCILLRCDTIDRIYYCKTKCVKKNKENTITI